MSPPLVKNKVEQLSEFLEELQKFENISFEDFEQAQHFLVERLFELLVIYASDILMGILAQRKEEMPTTLRTTFLRAGELNILPTELAQRLSDAAAMRNILVHAYTKVDLTIVYESIRPALKDFSEFVTIISQQAKLISGDESQLRSKDEPDDATNDNT